MSRTQGMSNILERRKINCRWRGLFVISPLLNNYLELNVLKRCTFQYILTKLCPIILKNVVVPATNCKRAQENIHNPMYMMKR